MAKAKKRSAGGPFFKPLLVVAAAAMIWGAGHAPGGGDVGALCAWVIGMLTVGLVMQAALSVAVPALTVLLALLRQSLARARMEDR